MEDWNEVLVQPENLKGARVASQAAILDCRIQVPKILGGKFSRQDLFIRNTHQAILSFDEDVGELYPDLDRKIVRSRFPTWQFALTRQFATSGVPNCCSILH